MTDEISKLVVEIAEEKAEIVDKSLVELSNGIRVRVNRISPLLLNDLRKRYKRPKPPMVHNSDIGRDEVNYNDPQYSEALTDYEEAVSVGMIDIFILMGTKVEPEVDYELVKEKLEDIIYLGYDVDLNKKKAMYLAYMKYIVLANSEDLQKIMDGIGRLTGVAETDVATAVDNFRSKSE